MRLAQIENNVVVNVAEVDQNNVPDFMASWVEIAEAGPGWLYDGENFSEPASSLEVERAIMECTPMQGQLALGEANWQKIIDYRDNTGDWIVSETVDPTPWSHKIIINSAQTWVRNSENIAFFAYLLGFTDAQVDDLFRVANLIEA